MKNELGQTIIEIMVAIGALTVLLSAITVVIITSLTGANFSRDQNSATEYAQQGMEIMRQLHNTDYGTFSALNGLYCVSSTCTTWDTCNPPSAASCPTNINAYFARSITITPITSNPPDCNSQGKASAEIAVKVAWSDGKCKTGNLCQNVTLKSCLSNTNIPTKP